MVINMIDKLKEKLDISVYVDMVVEDNGLITTLLDIIETDETSIKYIAEKIIRKISEDKPKMLYSYFDRMFKLIDSSNNFIRWGFIITIPNLLSVDKDNKWEMISDKYLSLLESTSVIEFGNTVSNVYKILERYPEYESDIVPRLLDIDRHTFLYHEQISKECNNVAIGHIMDCFDKIYDKSNYKNEIKRFVEKHKNNTRVSVRSKAIKFLKKLGN
jgi:hypothetical protein